MAELHVERKKRSNTLWVVVGVLVVALIAWMAIRGDDDVNRPRTVEGSPTSVLPALSSPAAVLILLNT
jgi:bacteriorhodopsin